MRVDNIYLYNFRNYERLKTDFDSHTNIIVGDNAQGKTNLLEAIYFFSEAKSFRARSDREIINFSGEVSEIEANIFSEEREKNIKIKIIAGRKKQIAVNSVKLKSSSSLAGTLTAVLFCPEDLYIIKEPASSRRKFIDRIISQLRPKYGLILGEFNKLYDSKVRILRDWREKPSLLKTLEEFNYQLAVLGTEIVIYRDSFIKKLDTYANEIHSEFSGNREKLKINYKTVESVDKYCADREKIKNILLEDQKKHIKKEIDSGLCLSGVQKDDIEITINGVSAKSFASQGQMRTAALSLKLAEREFLYRDKGEYPILLLDDVLSELDNERQNFVLNKIIKGQVFITCCEKEQIINKTNGRLFMIKEGKIVS